LNSYGYLCRIYSVFIANGVRMRYSIEVQGYGIIGFNGSSEVVSPLDAIMALLVLEACVENGICWRVGNTSYECDIDIMGFLEDAKNKALRAIGKYLLARYMYRRVLNVEKTGV